MTSATPRPLPRIERFERLGYGLFVHWGLYSILGKGEWAQYHWKIPTAEYAKLALQFDAAEFDPRAIARMARSAGMRYIVLTTRHHDGFSLYDTRGLSKFDAPHSPAARDLVEEFVTACREEGIVPFLYHTTLDWSKESDTCPDEKFEEYLGYLNDSVEILCSQYGELGGLWFDGNWSRSNADWKEDDLYAIIRRHQPEAIIINNTGLDARGAAGHPEIDSVTFEQGLPSTPDRRGWKKYLAGEMCETVNLHWGIGMMDFNFKSPAEIIRHLCACRKLGANYLLNIGPTATGAIPEYETALLHKVGKWIALHGDLLSEGRPVPASCPGNDFLLQKGEKYYYFAHDSGRRGSSHVVSGGGSIGQRTIEDFSIPITSMKWLAAGEAGQFRQSSDDRTLTLDCPGYDYGIDLVVHVAELR